MIALSQLYLIQKKSKMKIKNQIMANVRKIKPRAIFNFLYKLVYYIFVLAFISSGISKLYNPFNLLESMRLAFPVPTLALIAFVAFIAIFETILGLLLMFHIKIKQSLIAAAGLSLFFFFYSLVCINQRVPVDAGLFGGLIPCPVDFTLLISNSAFLLVAILLLIKEIELPE